MQYYWQNPDALAQIDQFKLNSLRDIERALGVTPIETVSIHPLKTLYEACRRMLESRARRIPLVDIDDETQREMVVSVLTQYRILKFVSVNVKETQMLRKPLRDLRVGSYQNLSFAHMDSPVIDVIQALVKRSISCVPILDKDGMVLNVFEAVDVIALIKGGDYDNLQLSVGKALEKRSDVRIRSEFSMTSLVLGLADTHFAGLPRHLHLHAKRPPGYNLRHDPQITRAPSCCHRRAQSPRRLTFAERHPRLHTQQPSGRMRVNSRHWRRRWQ